ncbi:MAG: TPM domain-containing protein [Clostridia bacterium]|nr:TPM domain-containing protein [Clostridia bacterium]
MGRSGHHSSRCSNHHYHRHGRGGELPLGFYIVLLVICLVIFISSEVSKTNQIKGKEKLNTDITIGSYLYDEANYFSDSKESELKDGLKYFYDVTGVQLVVYTTGDYVTEGYATKLYYELFTDESHIIVALPIKYGKNSDQYYYIGDDAETIITEVAMDELFDKIDSSWGAKEDAWKKSLYNVADLIVSK